MSPTESTFIHSMRVYWEDTDAGGVVFYANYLKFFERARTEWLRSRGVGQQALRDATGAIFVVVETSVRYLKPALLDDWIEVSVAIAEQRRASMSIVQQARRDAALLCEGRIRIACVDARDFRPRSFPAAVLQPSNPGPGTR